MTAPGEAGDAVVTRLDLHHARGLRDDGVGVHPQLELPRPAVGQQLRVARRLPARHPGRVAEFETTQPFDVEVALEARHHQPHRKAVRGPQRFAVLTISDESLVHDLVGEGNAAVDAGAVATFGQHPRRALVLGDEVDQEFERHAGPFIGADEAMRVLHRQIGIGLLPVLPAVAGAFDEHHARDRRHPLEIVDAEDQWLRDHAMDQQPVLCGIDIGHAGMAALVMQIGRRDVADQLLMRRLGVDGIAGIDVALAGCGLRNAIDLGETGSFAVRAEISAGPAIGNVGQRFRMGRLGRGNAQNARRQASHKAPARHIRRP